MISQLQYHSKEYTATLQLGATTASYDMEHPVNETFPTEHITKEIILETLQQFKGDIMQVPPTYSAVKKNGDRAYELRRRGEEVKLDAKPVHIEDIELLWFDPETKQAQIRVECGKGTYIRALARDIGRAMGCGAYLTQLCRTRLGDVRIEDCIKLDDFEQWLENNS
jgi:tRNA pseudouridine55 synthase